MAWSIRKIIECGLKAACSKICEEDKIWSRYSHDKVDIGEELARVIRTLSKAFPLTKPLRAFSIGSSAEPQFRILETAFRGGLYLLDLDKAALDIVKERVRRQHTDHVTLIPGDYKKSLLGARNARRFLKAKLDGEKVHLVTMHHSLYYSRAEEWTDIFSNLWELILAPKGAIHAVLMSSRSDDDRTTTWLYNHFAGKFCGCYNDQDLVAFGKEIRRSAQFKKAQIYATTHNVRFYVDDFAKFMAVVWMILLYPDVHKYTLRQREKITEFVYEKFWIKKRPLVQAQDHLAIYRGIGFNGLA